MCCIAFRIGGATSAGGASPDMLRRERRGAGEKDIDHIARSYDEDTECAGSTFESECGMVRQARYGTE